MSIYCPVCYGVFFRSIDAAGKECFECNFCHQKFPIARADGVDVPDLSAWDKAI